MRLNGHAILVALALTVGACAHAVEDPWAGKLYVGDQAQAAVVRAQAGEVVKCAEPGINDMVCMPSADFERLAERYHYFSEACMEVEKP